MVKEYTRFSTEKVRWVSKNKVWAIVRVELAGRNRIIVVNDKTGFTDWPIRYSNGTIGYDHPYRIPVAVKTKVRANWDKYIR